MPTLSRPKRKRTQSPLFVYMPPEERVRLALFVDAIGRPTTWVVRDALRAYMEALAPTVAQMRDVKVRPDLDNLSAPPKGRPRVNRPPKVRRPVGRPRKNAADPAPAV